LDQYVCYCNKVSESDIQKAIQGGARSLEEVIQITGAMKNSNCKVNNPKGVCCYADLRSVYEKFTGKANIDNALRSGCDCVCEQ
jgi:bacterioferritin-associated ferredoxin